MSDDQGLKVRRFERCQLRKSARLRIERASIAQVRPSSDSGIAGFIPAEIVDLSDGGVGLECAFFLPRRCTLVVELHATNHSAPVEVPVMVQRVRMSDRRPTYLIGTSFCATEDVKSVDLKRRIKQFQDKLMEVGKGGSSHAARP